VVLVTQARLKNKKHSYCSPSCGREAQRIALSGKPRTNNRQGKYAAMVRDGGKCVLCGFDIVTNVHHIIRKKDGGSNDLTNLVTLCPNHHHMVHAGIVTTNHLKKFATAFSFHDDIPKITREYKGKGADFRATL
jgi:5-methylcytosine-specific restriction endonuclease McrA